jgi:hypothetical protein
MINKLFKIMISEEDKDSSKHLNSAATTLTTDAAAIFKGEQVDV